MATYYVTSADVGAPSLSGTNGNGITVFDYVLVTIAGLTKVHSGTNSANYQMPNGDILHCVHDSATSGSAGLMVVRGAESASAINTLVDPYPTVALVADTSCNWHMSTTANATTRPWWALVDTTNQVFLFNVQIDAQVATYPNIWCGGGGSLLPVDNYCAFVTTRNSSSIGASATAVRMLGYPSLSLQLVWWKRSRDGTVKSVRGFIGPYAGADSNWGVSGGPVYPDPDDGKMRRSRAFAGDNYSQTATVGTSPEPMRCYVPHLWVGQHVTSGYSGIVLGDTFTDGAYSTQVGSTATFSFMPLGSATGVYGSQSWETTDTWSVPTEL